MSNTLKFPDYCLEECPMGYTEEDLENGMCAEWCHPFLESLEYITEFEDVEEYLETISWREEDGE